MRHLAAYMMLVLGGNASPSAADVTTALASVGIEVDEDRLNALISELEGKNCSCRYKYCLRSQDFLFSCVPRALMWVTVIYKDLSELIAEGQKKLASFGGGGGGGVAAAPAAGGEAAAGAPAVEEKKEEEEEDALEGGMDMFGDGGDY